MARANRWLEGPYAPLSTEVTEPELEVTGRVPEELCGRYLRNGPNPLTPPDPATYHWFTGTGMVHGVRLAEGRAQWYRNRWVRSAEVAATLGEPEPAGDVHAGMDFAPNTNVIGIKNRTFALVEAGARPYELTYELATVGRCDFDGTLQGGYTAHPKVDPKSGHLHAVSYFWGFGNAVRYTEQDNLGRVITSADVETRGPTSVHDTSITDRFVVVLDLPVVFDLEAAGSGATFPYRWDPGYEPRVGLLHRQDPTVVDWFDVEPCYVFHILNSYDDGQAVVLDVVRHPKMFATEVLGPDEGSPVLCRWRLEPGLGEVKVEILDDRGQEFPRVDERVIGARHRYGYAVGTGGGGLGDELGSALLRHDLERGRCEVRALGPGATAGEAVMVPRSQASAEDDGWVMALVFDPERGASDLLVLAADDFTGEPQAVVHLPVRVPHGFHGNWVPDP